MAYPEVDVGDDTYTVYADVDTADTYMGAALQGDTWRAADDDTKGRGLTTATRTLDRQLWKGEKFDSTQEHAFPRTGMGIDGLDDSAGVTPDGIIAGSIELALAIMDGSDVQDDRTTAERIRSISAGSVSISNFRGVDTFLGMGSARFPLIIQELVGPYLAGADSSLGIGKATGTGSCSVFPGNYSFARGV